MEPKQNNKKIDGPNTSQTESREIRSWLLLGGVIVVVMAILAALFLNEDLGVAEQTSVAQQADQSIAAPDFQLSVYQGTDALPIDGEEGQFSELFRQNQPVVLNFWAGLCPPCRAEMPAFQQVYDEMGDQFILVGLDIGPFVHLGSREDGRALLQELGVTYPAATTFDENIVNEYQIRGMPTTVFLTPDGEIYDTHTGLLNAESLRSEIQAVLQASDG